MIKRIASCLLALILIFTLAGCANAPQPQTPDSQPTQGQAEPTQASVTEHSDAPQTDAPQTVAPKESSAPTGENEPEESGSDTLVVYFSRTGEQYKVGVIDNGNTAIVAEMIGDRTGADLWEVMPANDHYPMTYSELLDVAKRELNENARPAYAGEVLDLSQYNTIFIGAPVWWGDWPMIMYTFFEQNADAFAGKLLIPFSTHEGSGLSGFDRKLSSACPNSTVGTGLAVRGSDCQNKQESVRETVNKWLAGSGY
ncbi:MAG: flavodoxin [Clostridia bacterium]|nr:flavodoxin [Clostridia bacterium]